jgi:hypothetical protein
MDKVIAKGSLPPGRRQLLELMQQINFGCIESLEIEAGEPIFRPAPRVVREIKFGGDNGPRPERAVSDFLVKLQVRELFACLDEIRDGTIAVIEVKHGLPFRMLVARPGD